MFAPLYADFGHEPGSDAQAKPVEAGFGDGDGWLTSRKGPSGWTDPDSSDVDFEILKLGIQLIQNLEIRSAWISMEKAK